MILLAQNTFESYKEIGTHPEFQYDLENPFNPDFLLEVDRFFLPWVGDTWLYFIWLLAMGVLLLWIHRRVNDTPLFENMGWILVAMAVNLVLFFRTAWPHPLGLLIMSGLLVGLVVNLTAVLTVAAVQKLPYFGVDEKKLTDPRTGLVRPHVPYVVAAVVVLALYFLLPLHARVMMAVLQYWPTYNVGVLLQWVVMFLTVVVAGMVGMEYLPWRNVPGQTVLGGGPMKELAPIFRMDGPAPRGEVVVVGLGVFFLYVSTLFIFKRGRQITGADLWGLACMSFLAFIIMRAELSRAARAEGADERIRPKGPWA